jgi:hypothetical protein
LSTILAYVSVIVLSSLTLSLSAVVLGFLVALALAWTSIRVRVTIAGIAGGALGVVASVLVACVAFRWIAGPTAYGVGPFLASVVPLGGPILNDIRKAREIDAALASLPRSLPEDMRSGNALRHTVTGYFIGIAIVCAGFAVHAARS